MEIWRLLALGTLHSRRRFAAPRNDILFRGSYTKNANYLNESH